MKNFTQIILAVALLTTLGLTAVAAQAAQGHYDFFAQRMAEPWEALLGKPAPNVKLPLLGQGAFDLSSFKDKKVVVMDFWASWCPPCRLIMPTVAEVAEVYKDKDVYFCAINQAEEAESVQKFVDSTGLKLNIALDAERTASSAYGVDSIPRLIVVGKDGTVQAIHAGLEGSTAEEVKANTKKRLSQELDKLLAGQSLVEPNKKDGPDAEPKVTAQK